MNNTLSYYKENAESFISGTINADISEVSTRFLACLPQGAYILDFGCGSGRDTKAFLEKGYRVDAIDGSEELCSFARAFTGIDVRCMLFNELDEIDKYDGIWACSSILHAPKSALPEIFARMSRALKDDGVIYASFKYGENEGERKGRYFSDFTSESFAEFLKEFPALQLLEEWISADVRPGREEEKWLNILLRKSATR